MATKTQWKKQVNNHVITWSERQQRYVVKKKGRQVYDADTESSAVNWVKRNS